jgi:D-alanyl-D-alanine carboxypeptidase (penicillin-binding protein 5/6)
VYDYDRRPNFGPLILGVLAVFLLVAIAQMLRGVPDPEYTVTFPASSPLGDALRPLLPEEGASIIAASGLGTLGSAGSAEPRPIASITKMMTAYVVLKDHPLAPGETGPIIELTAADEERWLEMLAQDQSSLPVFAGQRLTQLQLLQGLLVPSANNYAEILAAWDAGSVEAFVARMNAEAQALGMSDTVYTDTSGFSSETVSTPVDQLILARAAMQDPVFAATVRLEQVTIPSVGAAASVNLLLGVDGVVGIKTGFTEEAGGNFAFAAIRDAGGQQVDVYGVVLGQGDGIDGFESRQAAFNATQTALASIDNGLEYRLVLSNRQPVATVSTDWGDDVSLVLNEDVELLTWPGVTMETSVEVEDISPGKAAGEQVGWVNVILGEQARRLPLVLADDLDGPGLFWRLTRF